MPIFIYKKCFFPKFGILQGCMGIEDEKIIQFPLNRIKPISIRSKPRSSLAEVVSEEPIFLSRVLLTEEDRVLVLKQCEQQGATSPQEVANFLAAYIDAKKFALTNGISRITPGETLHLLKILGYMVCPEKNQNGFRIIPASFSSGNRAVDSHAVESAVEKWAEVYTHGIVNPDTMYTEFENIHPFEDGNGRVGHLMWAIDITRRSGDWPMRLPPDVFNPNSGYKKPRYESSFGEVED